MARVVFVGSNPSVKSDTNEAFSSSTRSGRILKSWIDKAGISDYSYINISDEKTPNNRPLTIHEIRSCMAALHDKLVGAQKIVALGKTAAKAMSMSDLSHIVMPHPSGLNRQLNDPKYVEAQIGNLRQYASDI